jgi:hypothetical protein
LPRRQEANPFQEEGIASLVCLQAKVPDSASGCSILAHQPGGVKRISGI